MNINGYDINSFLGDTYDILAQNPIDQDDRDQVTEMIDHIDYDQGYIQLNNGDRLQYVLKENQ